MFRPRRVWVLGSTSRSKLSDMAIGTTRFSSHVCILVSDLRCFRQTKTARQDGRPLSETAVGIRAIVEDVITNPRRARVNSRLGSSGEKAGLEMERVCICDCRAVVRHGI